MILITGDSVLTLPTVGNCLLALLGRFAVPLKLRRDCPTF